MEDERIIALYWARDEDAIAETSSKYGKLCHLVAANILSSREDSEECVNDTYLGLWNAIPAQRPSRFSVFASRITRNLALKRFEYLSAAKRNPETVCSLEELGDCVSGKETIESELENRRLEQTILFVCHGNICRSPMAEFVMKDLVKKAGLVLQFRIESAATSREEIGNPVYPPARCKLTEHGISCDGHAARQLTNQDYDKYDLLIGMDSANLKNMQRICGGDPDGKLHLLMDYTDRPGDVADPWYTDDFEATWQDVLAGCQGLLANLMSAEKQTPERLEGGLF
jgi:protein-tyrosine phosphatase